MKKLSSNAKLLIGAADHDNIKITYNNDQKEYALSVSNTQMMLFDTTNGQTSWKDIIWKSFLNFHGQL